MPRNVRTARGEIIDFDALIIKQQLAQAPMNIEVARRKEFIDNKEGRGRGPRQPTQVAPTETLIDETVEASPVNSLDFEVTNPPVKKK